MRWPTWMNLEGKNTPIVDMEHSCFFGSGGAVGLLHSKW